NRTAATNRKSSWLSDTLKKVAKKGKSDRVQVGQTKRAKDSKSKSPIADHRAPANPKKKSSVSSVVKSRGAVKKNEISQLKGAEKAPFSRAIRPMLATLVDEPFNDKDWLYEVKWDGYRALAYLDGGDLRLVSRNQNDLTAQFPELRDLATHLKARHAVLDGEVVALDERGHSSFSLMQQRGERDIPIRYYVFDLLYLDGYSLMRVDLEDRKRLLESLLAESELVRYSEHFDDGLALFRAAAENALEGIVAKRRRGCYVQKRSREWLKMKVTRRQECVIAGYTDPRGGREHFGSIVLGLYDDKGKLVHVGNAGSGFNERTHADMWKRMKKLATTTNPFGPGVKVEASRRAHFVRPELVAEIKFSEWT